MSLDLRTNTQVAPVRSRPHSGAQNIQESSLLIQLPVQKRTEQQQQQTKEDESSDSQRSAEAKDDSADSTDVVQERVIYRIESYNPLKAYYQEQNQVFQQNLL